jgi:hypothetical protein
MYEHKATLLDYNFFYVLNQQIILWKKRKEKTIKEHVFLFRIDDI